VQDDDLLGQSAISTKRLPPHAQIRWGKSQTCDKGLHALPRLLLNGRIRPEAVQPNYIGLVPEPSHLALGVLPGSDLAFIYGLIERESARENLLRLLVAERLEGLGLGREAGCEEGLGFFQQTAVKHGRRTSVEALAQQRSIRGEAELENGEALKPIARGRLNMGGGLAGQQGQL